MKVVEIMKQAINDSNKGYYKWTAKRNSLEWEYGVTFKLIIAKDELDNVYVKLIDDNTDENTVVFVACEEDAWLCDDYHDFVKTEEEAIYWVTRKMINRAQKVY